MRFIYNLLFPVAFLFFLPGLVYKFIWRPGYKKTFGERFGIFSEERKALLSSYKGAIWIHAVSVGETMVALAFLKKWMQREPSRKFILSTTTTTGQELARSKAPAEVPVIFCPLDLGIFVKKVMKMIQPSMLAILETEIWPNLLYESKKYGKAVLINGRMSDHSVKGYRRFKIYFAPIFSQFDLACVQTEDDRTRYLSVAPSMNVKVCGNIKFDQEVPHNLKDIDLKSYFGSDCSEVLLAASTHPGEEKLIAETFAEIKKTRSGLRLVIVPRHAERGAEIVSILNEEKISFCRRSLGVLPEKPVDVLLADTTGEMLGFIKAADIVIMGKSLAGHDEGHNLIEPALLSKPIITGAVLKNFRFVLNALLKENAVVTVDSDAELKDKICGLLNDKPAAAELGKRACAAIAVHKGAADRILDALNFLNS